MNKYDFVDSAFDGTKSCETRAKYSHYDEDNTETAPEEKPYLKKIVLMKDVLQLTTTFATTSI